MRWTSGRAWAGVAAVGAAFVIAGCSGSGGTQRSGAVNDAAGGSSSRYGTAAVPSAAEPAKVPTGGGGTAVTTAEDDTASTVRIRTARVTLDVPHDSDVSRQADAAALLTTQAGGEVDSDDRTAGEHPVATMVLRVPPAALTATLRAIGRLGSVTSQEQASKDVTAQVADVGSRVASAQRAIARLRTLYDSAAKVSDVLAVEQDLTQREADLEALQAQQRSLAGQTSLAAITLTVQPAAAGPTHHSGRGGFVGGLQDGWTGFRHAATAVVRAVGAALPFLVLLVVFAGAGRLVLRRRRPAPQPAEE